MTVIAAHCSTLAPTWSLKEGFVGGPERVARLCLEHEGLHADLSALTSLARGPLLRRVLDDERLRDRLVDGSDFPVPPRACCAVRPPFCSKYWLEGWSKASYQSPACA